MNTLTTEPNAPTPSDFTLEQIDEAIEKGLDYLEQHQFPYGEFCCFQSGDDSMQGWTHQVNMLFPTMLVCQSLLYLPQTERVKKMTMQSGWFLRYYMGRSGTWMHYTWMHIFSEVLPRDVDDSCCIGNVLEQLGIDYPKDATRRMVLSNRNGQGLFYTWFAFRWRWNSSLTYWRLALREFLSPIKGFLFWNKMECSRNDVDAIVNANVLCHLGETAETKPVVDWLLRIIAEGREAESDKWYRTPHTAYYFISRCIAAGIKGLEPARQTIIDRIKATLNSEGRIGPSELDTALGICALINLGYEGQELDAACKHLLKTQNRFGNWPRWRLYYGGPKKLSGYGSEELSTAFCLQALSRYQKIRGLRNN